MFHDLLNSENHVWSKRLLRRMKNKMEKSNTIEFTPSVSGGIVFELKTLPTPQKPTMFAWNILINLFLQ